MQRLGILLINRDATFMWGRGAYLERRGCDVYPAQTVDEVRELMRLQHFVLCAINGPSAGLTPETLKVLHQALRRSIPMPFIVMVGEGEAEKFAALELPDVSIVVPPYGPRRILAMSEQLVGVGERRTTNTLVQLHDEESGRTRMAFIENISRHGLLVRVDLPLPSEFRGVASFVLPGVREQNDVRVRFARQHGKAPPYRYGLAYTQITPEAFERIARFVAGP